MRIETKKNDFGRQASIEDMALNPEHGYVPWGPTHSRSISAQSNKDTGVHHLIEWSLFYERFRRFAEMIGHQCPQDERITSSTHHLSHRLKTKILEDTTKEQMFQSIVISCNVDSSFPDGEEQLQPENGNGFIDLTLCLQNLRLRSKNDEKYVRNFVKYGEEDLNITDRLHNIPSFRNLLQRALALSSFDTLDHEGTQKWMNDSGTDTNVLLKDLHLEDLTILPLPRQSSVASFQSICLYRDVNRRIRLHHIYENKAKTPEFPHNHYGDSASLIMTGKMVNQLISLKEVDEPTRNQIELDKLCLEGASSKSTVEQVGLEYLEKGIFGYRKIKRYAQSKSKTNLFQNQYVQASVISSHAYHKGDYYLLPKDDYHRVTGSAVTLFTQAYNKKRKDANLYEETSYTTETVTAPHEIVKSLGDNSVVNTLAIEELLKGIQRKFLYT